MIFLKYFFHLAFLTVVLYMSFSCAGKQITQPELELIQDKEDILWQISRAMPELCEYNGRVVIRFMEDQTLRSTSAILNKECRGDIIIKILGPFGIQLAELSVRGDKYFVFRGGKDVTNEHPAMLDATDIMLLKNSLPPPLPDGRYTLLPDINQYIFTFEDEYIFVTPDYYISGVQRKDHKFDYLWGEGVLKNIRFVRRNMEVTLEFVDSWR